MPGDRVWVESGGSVEEVVRQGDRRVTAGSPAAPFTVRPVAAGAYVVVDQTGQQERVYVAGPPEARWVFVAGTVYQLTVSETPPSAPRASAELSDTLTAPMPATVVKVLASEGQHVQRGDPIVILEAMKMELPVRAGRDGHLVHLHCREGQLVQAGAVLAEVQ